MKVLHIKSGKAKDARFPNAPWLTVELHTPLLRPRVNLRISLGYYMRNANAALVSLLWGTVVIVWRMPWVPRAAYMKGWNACFRQIHGMGEFSGRKDS